MARPPKLGLDYFPKDVDFYNDYKIMDLLEKYGPVGTIIYDVILTEIYRNGYYLVVTSVVIVSRQKPLVLPPLAGKE